MLLSTRLMMKNNVASSAVMRVMKLLELLELNSVAEALAPKEAFILALLLCCSMIRPTRPIATIRKTTKRALYIINLFFAELLRTNALTNKAGVFNFFY